MGARTGIGEALRSVRTARAMSLSEVATAAGISTATLSRIETGKQSLDVAVLVRICAILHVPAAQLLGGEAEGRTSEEALVSSLAALPSENRVRIIAAAAKRHAGRHSRQQLQVQLDSLLATIDVIREELTEMQRQARSRH